MVAERRDNDKEVEEYHIQEREVLKTVNFIVLTATLI